MITLTRLNGSRFALNCDLIERVDTTPDTVLTLVDGTKYVVAERLNEVLDAVRAFRTAVIAAASAEPAVSSPAPLRVVSAHEEEG